MDPLAGFPAILISGGTKFRNYEYFEYENEYDYVATESRVEVISPTKGEVSCKIPDLPAGRSGHTMDTINRNENIIICGGSDASTQNSCIQITPFGWEETHTLLHDRWLHTSWVAGSGLILFGGYHSAQTTEIFRANGGFEAWITSYSFRM